MPTTTTRISARLKCVEHVSPVKTPGAAADVWVGAQRGDVRGCHVVAGERPVEAAGGATWRRRQGVRRADAQPRGARGAGGARPGRRCPGSSFRGHQMGQHIVFSGTYIITVLHCVDMRLILQLCGRSGPTGTWHENVVLTTQPRIKPGVCAACHRARVRPLPAVRSRSPRPFRLLGTGDY